MNTVRLGLAVLLVAGCEGRADLGGAPPCECVSTPPAPVADSGAEAASEPDAPGSGPDAPGVDTGSETSALVDAPADAWPTAYPAWCSDHVTDGDETDVDCGGHCLPCGPRQGCLIDADCSATAAGCDVASGGCYCDAVALMCVHSHCFDHVRDADESDGDCGGATCVLCAVGQACASDVDCAAAACDTASLRCIADQCADHVQDGLESAVDCGGPVCVSCALGQHCFSTLDCPAGHVCAGSSKVCQ
jgi:hypothetical protein